MPKTVPTAKRTRMTSDERRQQITESARTVFLAHGLAGARTRDIAAEAGVNEAMLYRHFTSKEALYEAAVVGPLGDAVASLVEVSGEPPSQFDTSGEAMRERTTLFLRDLLRVMDDFGPLLGVALFGDAEHARDYYLERIAPTIETIKSVVANNLGSWTHRDFDLDTTVHTVFGAAWFLSTTARLEGRTLDIDAVAGQVASMVLDGLVLREADLD